MGNKLNVLMTDREFRDTLGALSAFVIYEDATGVHNGGVKATAWMDIFSSIDPISIWAIGAGCTSIRACFYQKTSITKIYCKNWDMSTVTNIGYAFRKLGIESMEVENWDTSHITTMDLAFATNANLRHIDCSKWDTTSVTNCRECFSTCPSLVKVGLFPIPSGCDATSMFYNSPSVADLYFGESAKVYPSLDLSTCPLTFQSVINVFNALADTPDTGATITFKSGLYAAFTEEQKAVIDEKRAAAVTNGWAIVNMGGA